MKSVRLFALSTLLAVIITVPAIVLTLLLHYIVKLNIMTTMIIGILVFIATMGLGVRFSKRLMSGDKNTIDL
jgi:ABC-type protease/lipase transport system fused ATPase/permease subunit